MAGSNALALIAGGVVVVALSFGAGMLGGSTAAPEIGDSAPSARSVPDSVVRGRLDELDRRVSNVEERLRVVEETANEALNKAQEIDRLRRVVDGLRAGGISAHATAGTTDSGPIEVRVPDGDTVKPLTDEERAAREEEQREKLRRDAKALAQRHAEPLLKRRLLNIANATAQGAADRNSQLYAETKQMAVLYSMTPDEEDRLREIMVETSESTVREIAPYLGGGLERADLTTVKTKLFEVWDARDAHMADLLDETELEDYQETQKGWREAYSKVLDAWQKSRDER